MGPWVNTFLAEGCIVGVCLETRCVGRQYSFLTSEPHGRPVRTSFHLYRRHVQTRGFESNATADEHGSMDESVALFFGPPTQCGSSGRFPNVAMLFPTPGCSVTDDRTTDAHSLPRHHLACPRRRPHFDARLLDDEWLHGQQARMQMDLDRARACIQRHPNDGCRFQLYSFKRRPDASRLAPYAEQPVPLPPS